MIDVTQFVLNRLQESDPRLTLTDKFSDTWIDSLSLVELQQEIDEVYGVEIPEVWSCQTTTEIINLIQEKLRGVKNE